MREHFEDRKFTGDIKIYLPERNANWIADKAQLAAAIQSVSEQYLREGYALTLRQLYYQLVSKDMIPNHDKTYKKIGSIKDDCVYAGQVDWSCFEDRSRVPYIPYSNDGIADAIQSALDCFSRDRQEGQEIHVELWTEKDAISDILKKALSPYHVRLCVNKGYTSSSAIYKAYTRFCNSIKEGKRVLVLYFGDHDPSGLDMIRDIRERLNFMLRNGDQFEVPEEWWNEGGYNIFDVAHHNEEFSDVELLTTELSHDKEEKLYKLFKQGQRALFLEENDLFNVKQIGLTKEQIRKYNLPPNPAKLTDPRAKKYVQEHGNISWEVDALEPRVLRQLVIDEIEAVIDMDQYEAMIETENEERKELAKIVKKYQ